MQRVDYKRSSFPFDIVINTNSSQNQSDNKNLTILESQTPLSENVLLPKIPESSVIASSETETPAESFSSNSDTQENDLHIPLDVETMSILSSMLENEEYETGISNKSERYFEQLLKDSKMAAMNGLSVLFMDNYSVEGRKENILIGILHIVSHLEYEIVYPQGQMMAISALSHKSKEVEEYGIKCFEDWGHRDGINKLQSIKFNSDWLCDYAEEVIKELSAGE